MHWSSHYLYALLILQPLVKKKKNGGLTYCGLAVFFIFFFLHKAMCFALWHLSSWVLEYEGSLGEESRMLWAALCQ